MFTRAFQVAQWVNNLPAMQEMQADTGSILGLGRSSGGGHGNLLQYFLPGKFHEQRSLVGYSPWGRKESDTTERLSTTHPKNTTTARHISVC